MNPEKQRRFRLPKISPGTVIASIALIVALGGVAHSAVPGPDGKINACYLIDPDPDFSYVYLVNENTDCQPGEEKIGWAQSPVDQALANEAKSEADGIDFSGLNGVLKQVGPALQKLTGNLSGPKVPAKAKTVNPFKGKQKKSMLGFLDFAKKNRREQARYNKQMREALVTLNEALQKAAQPPQSINDVVKKLIRSIRL